MQNLDGTASAKETAVKHLVEHDLDLETVTRVVHLALDSYVQRFSGYSPQLKWTSERNARVSFKAKGITLNGTVEVRPRNIAIDLDVPFILRVFKKKAIDVIEREMRKWLEKARAGELDG